MKDAWYLVDKIGGKKSWEALCLKGQQPKHRKLQQNNKTLCPYPTLLSPHPPNPIKTQKKLHTTSAPPSIPNILAIFGWWRELVETSHKTFTWLESFRSTSTQIQLLSVILDFFLNFYIKCIQQLSL